MLNELLGSGGSCWWSPRGRCGVGPGGLLPLWGALPAPPSGWLPSGAQGSHRPSLRLPPPWPGDEAEVTRRMPESLAQSLCRSCHCRLCHHSPSGRGRGKGRRGCPAPGPPETWPRDRQCGRPGWVTACSATEWATGCGLAVAPALLPRGSSCQEEALGAGSTLEALPVGKRPWGQVAHWPSSKQRRLDVARTSRLSRFGVGQRMACVAVPPGP